MCRRDAEDSSRGAQGGAAQTCSTSANEICEGIEAVKPCATCCAVMIEHCTLRWLVLLQEQLNSETEWQLPATGQALWTPATRHHRAEACDSCHICAIDADRTRGAGHSMRSSHELRLMLAHRNHRACAAKELWLALARACASEKL